MTVDEVRVQRAVAVIGVRPATVYSFEHSHVFVSQSQSCECPVKVMAMLAVSDVAVNCVVAAHLKKVQS
jgi:hypothetical protein